MATTKQRRPRRQKQSADKTQNIRQQPKLSIVLPTWNNLNILWLQLEALLRQDTKQVFEVIIHECPVSGGYPSEELIVGYMAKFAQRSVHVEYIRAGKRTPLVNKWRELAAYATSDNLLMVASDNYTPANAVEAYCAAFADGYDWIDCPNGVFYDIASRKVAEFRAPEGKTGVLFATKTRNIRELPTSDLDRNIDGYIKSHVSPESVAHLEFTDGVLTDGYNTISHHRATKYSGIRKRPPFYDTDKTLEDLVPADIALRLRKMKPVVVG
jgi:hypothetical protein